MSYGILHIPTNSLVYHGSHNYSYDNSRFDHGIYLDIARKFTLSQFSNDAFYPLAFLTKKAAIKCILNKENARLLKRSVALDLEIMATKTLISGWDDITTAKEEFIPSLREFVIIELLNDYRPASYLATLNDPVTI